MYVYVCTYIRIYTYIYIYIYIYIKYIYIYIYIYICECKYVFFGRCGCAKGSARLTSQQFHERMTQKKEERKTARVKLAVWGLSMHVRVCASVCLSVSECVREKDWASAIQVSPHLSILSLSLSLFLSLLCSFLLSLPLSPLSLSLFRTVGRLDRIRAHTWFSLQCCIVLQCVAVCYNVLWRVKMSNSVLQCVTVCCSALQCVAVRCAVRIQICVKRHTTQLTLHICMYVCVCVCMCVCMRL